VYKIKQNVELEDIKYLISKAPNKRVMNILRWQDFRFHLCYSPWYLPPPLFAWSKNIWWKSS